MSSSSVNKIILIGRLGQDAKKFEGEKSVNLKFSIATDDYAGKEKTVTNWHRCSLWGKLAEALEEHLVKGKQVYVEGELHYWADEEDHTHSEIKVQEIRLLSPSKPKENEEKEEKNNTKKNSSKKK